jgi:hypothetical protein
MVKFIKTQVTSLQESEETHAEKQAKKKSLTLPRPNGKLL